MRMKNFCSPRVWLALMLLLAASPALAQSPALTLRDSARGTIAGLYPSQDQADRGLLLYINERFEYSVKIPYEVFTEVVVIPDNGDGIILESKDRQRRFRVSGGFAILDDTFATSLKNAKEYVEKNVDGAQVFEKTGDGWWQLSWWNGTEKGIRKFLTNGKMWCDIEIRGPGQPRNAPGAYDDLLERSLTSLALSAPFPPPQLPLQVHPGR